MTDTLASTPQVASRFNPWNEIAGIGVAVIEASWLVLIFQSLNASAASTPTALVFFYFAFVFYAGFQMVRAFQQVRLMQNAARAVLLLSYVLLTWLGIRLLVPVETAAGFDPFTTSLRGLNDITTLIPARYWLIPILLWLFLRGSSAARKGVGTFAVQRHFRLGVIMFLLYSGLAFTAMRDLPGLGIFTIFMFATLLAMSAARVAILGRLRGGRRSPFSRSWFGGMSGAVAMTIGVGFTAAMLTTGRFLIFYRQVLLGIFFGAVTITLSPFLFILSLYADTPVQSAPAPPPEVELPPWEQDGFSVEISESLSRQVDIIPPEYRPYFYWGLTALAILIVIGLFFGVRTMTRRRQAVELTEYVLQPGDWLSRFRKEMERRRKELQDAMFGSNALARGQQILAAARIRRIYAALIELAESFGAPRDPAQTPLEFMGVLQDRLTGARSDVQTITFAYLKIRYGELPERAEEVQAVELAWTKVQSAAAPAVKAHEARMKEEEKERKRRMEQAR